MRLLLAGRLPVTSKGAALNYRSQPRLSPRILRLSLMNFRNWLIAKRPLVWGKCIGTNRFCCPPASFCFFAYPIFQRHRALGLVLIWSEQA